jgi:hypothetical protein
LLADAMTKPTRSSDLQVKESIVTIFVCLLSGPITWLLHFTVVYALQSTVCALASGAHLVPLFTIIVTLLALLVLVAAAWGMVFKLPNAGGPEDQFLIRFLPRTIRLLCLLSAVGIIWTCFAALFLSPCAPLR